MNAEVFEHEIQKSNTYGACDGSSFPWRSVGGIISQLLKEDGEVWPSEGLQSPWRSILQVHHEVQRSNPVPIFQEFKYFGTKTLDGPLCLWRSVILAVEGNEESSKRNCTSMGRQSPLQSVMTTTIRREVRRLSRVLTDFQLIESLFN